MKLDYKDHSNKPGIYKILNTHTNRIYIGQAKEFKVRWYSHQRSLLTGKHQNKFLLNDFSKCRLELGHDNFLEFHVLEVMENSTKEERNAREEALIALYFDSQNLCYNFKQKTASKERTVFSNDPEQTKRLLSEAQKRLWQNPEERQKRIEGVDGKRREKIGKASSKVWAEMPEVQKQAIAKKRADISIESWKEPEIRQKRLDGLRANSWKVSQAQKQRAAMDPAFHARLVAQGQAAAKTYILLNPKGVLTTIHNMTKFCRENGLTKQCMLRVAKGTDSTHKGWKKKAS